MGDGGTAAVGSGIIVHFRGSQWVPFGPAPTDPGAHAPPQMCCHTYYSRKYQWHAHPGLLGTFEFVNRAALMTGAPN